MMQGLIWSAISVAGALGYAMISFYRREPVNAVWLLIAAACTYAVAYRFYSKWLAAKVLALNDLRATPCRVHEDGKDFVRTHPWIVFGHHFAAISGPGPLVGPVLAAQFGYLPGALWLLIGVVLGGAVQDFLILFCSLRRDGKSLGEMVREEIGTTAGLIALAAVLGIIVILIAVLALVVDKALAGSPWGTFTLAATIPIALCMGIYLRYIRPGKVLEVTCFGVAALLLAVWGGKWAYDASAVAALFNLNGRTLAWCLIGYGLAASALPVWLLLAPRDYLSAFLKLGTIALLALGIVWVLPPLRMPALSRFIDGTGPVFAGNIFPFCFITIACGAISGFHSLIASGTTPKLIARESHARSVGYGSMLLESAVAVMALIAAASLEPGVYFAVNSPAAAVGATSVAAAHTISAWGFPVTAASMAQLAQAVGEPTLFGRAGGAPTLALGMAHIFSGVLGGQTWMGLWYHFALMFEALFILTTVDAGTRVGRFILQAFLGHFHPAWGNTRSRPANLAASALLVAAWGYFLYQGVVDPQGGINSLWPLFGIANQLLALIALCLATTVLLKMGRRRRMWITALPLLWLGAVTFTAGLEKIFSANPKIGFLSGAKALAARLAEGALPAAQAAALGRAAFNLKLDAVVAAVFLLLVAAILAASLRRWWELLRGGQPDLRESAPVWLTPEQLRESPAAGMLRPAGAVAGMLLALLRQGGMPPPPQPLPDQGVQLTTAAELGAAWARQEEERLQKPRCC